MEISYQGGFYCLLLSLLAGIGFCLTALQILGLAAILWIASILLQDLYYRVM